MTTATETFELDDKAKGFIATYTQAMIEAAGKARDQAMWDLRTYLEDHGNEDLRANVIFAAEKIVADILADRSHLVGGWLKYTTWDSTEIRRKIWEAHADTIVKAELQSKDEEIARLKRVIESNQRHY